jgi:hypothetical protein
MGVELITALEACFGVRLPVMAISEDATIERLAIRLIGLLRKDQQTDATVQAIEDIAAQHAADTSPEEIAALARSLDSAIGRSPDQSKRRANTTSDKLDSQRSLLS